MRTFEEEVALAVEALKSGKVILYPTDTIWGLGCDATNAKAVEKIYRIKRRIEKKSLIALVESEEQLKQYVKKVPELAYDLIRNAANPLSIVYPGAQNLAKNMIAADKTVCIRITSNEFCAAIIKGLKKAITSTSANISGQSAPLIFYHISEEIKKSVDHIVGLYQDDVEIPKASTIIRLEQDGTFEILRP
ncbi:MAG: L-threonylcarbamoyladenylate synthase [Bacteroidales bacterium]|jgi:L-threonylcarbamoyladenylate synthase|nr:L-threonylcarbamoyladenylate synthase [Bacteroidales bacterium]HOI31680.1 L-threonylcarbamoyladenylate synthase [Bacteroidales bacterium]